MTTTHKKLSMSGAPRWGVCPGSIRECAKYPEESSGAAAIDGTHTHTTLETSVTKQISPAELVGQTLSDHEGEFVVDKDRAERVQFALDYINSRQIDLGFPELHSEMKVDLVRMYGRDDAGGTADVVLVGDDVVEIIDYKDGMGPVDPESWQLKGYGFCIISMFGGEKFVMKQKTMRLTIIQPKLRAKGHPGISFVDIPMSTFMAQEWDFNRMITATDDPNAPLVAGDHCNYCRHRGACTALSDKAMGAAGIVFPNLDVAQQAADKDPTTMSDQQIREILEAAPLIRQMLEGAEKEAMRRFNAGKPIDGLKLVAGRGSRSWAYPDEEMAEKLKRFGLPKDAIWKTSLISPAQAEKVTWQKRDGTAKQLSDKQLKLMASEYIKKSDGALKVVPVSDERPAVSSDVSHLFQNVEVPDFLK